MIQSEQDIELTDFKVLKEQVIPKPVFHNTFRKANCCSRLFYTFMNDMIDKVNTNGGMKEEYIIDMTLKDNDTET